MVEVGDALRGANRGYKATGLREIAVFSIWYPQLRILFAAPMKSIGYDGWS